MVLFLSGVSSLLLCPSPNVLLDDVILYFFVSWLGRMGGGWGNDERGFLREGGEMDFQELCSWIYYFHLWHLWHLSIYPILQFSSCAHTSSQSAMPSNIKIRINSARNLPIMDRTLTGVLTTDAYVTVTLGGHKNWIEHNHRGEEVSVV